MAMKLITAPDPIVTWEEADAHLQLSGDETDRVYVESLIAAATSRFDGWDGLLGRALGPQTWELTLDAFPCDAIKIGLPSLISIASIKYYDADGVEQTISASNYQVDTVSFDGWVVPISGYSWPSTLSAINAVRVRFQSGYSPVPASLKSSILRVVGHWYENREAGGAIPDGLMGEFFVHKANFFV